MGMVMMGIGWRGPLIQEGAVNRALTSYGRNPTVIYVAKLEFHCYGIMTDSRSQVRSGAGF